MQRIAVDFHIHSALSPCSNDEMTPNNIVNMAILKGLDAIAVTDHNSCDNLPAVITAADENIIILPGMEIQTIEEVHVLGYFPDYNKIKAFDNELKLHLSNMKNKPDFFGRQIIFDAEDNEIGERKEMLINSVDLSIEDVTDMVRNYGGVVIPAHIERQVNGIISQLGFIPRHLNYDTIEVSHMGVNPFPENLYNVIKSSDAHHLGSIMEKEFFIDVETMDSKGLFNYLVNRP